MTVHRSRLAWFVDRALGGKLVPDALCSLGVEVHPYAELYPDDDAVPDEVWIPEVAGRGWAILTKDKKIRRDSAQRAILIAARESRRRSSR